MHATMHATDPNTCGLPKAKDEDIMSPAGEKLQSGSDNDSPADFQAAHHEEASGGIFDGEFSRNMSRWDTLLALLSTQFGLGILSLPGTMRDLGIIPGTIGLIGIGIITGYAGLILLQFYAKHPHCVNVIDMIYVLGGRSWQIVGAIGLLIQLLLICASTGVTMSVALNTLTNHSVCTVGFIGIGCIFCWILCIPRTVKFIAHSGYPTFVSVFAAAMIVIISLGASQPEKAPEGWEPDFKLFAKPSFRLVVSACLRMVSAFASNISFVTYMAEMRNPVRDFPWALGGLISISITFYLTVAISIYCLAGEYTTSPALGSAPLLPAKIAYGIVIPAVLTAGLSNGHVGAKYIFIETLRALKRTNEATQNTALSWSLWIACVTIFWVASLIISNIIPIFDSILSISSATTFAWFTYGVSALLWFNINRGSYFDGWKNTALFVVNCLLIVLSLFLNAAGLWATVTEMLDFFKQGGVRGVFDCGDNAIF
ncbi:hypothetical protein ACHAPT_010316 [Fusarium lateritium]